MKKAIIIMVVIAVCLSTMSVYVSAGCPTTGNPGYTLAGSVDITPPYITNYYCQATCSWYEFWKQAMLYNKWTKWQCTYYRNTDGATYNTVYEETTLTQSGCC